MTVYLSIPVVGLRAQFKKVQKRPSKFCTAFASSQMKGGREWSETA